MKSQPLFLSVAHALMERAYPPHMFENADHAMLWPEVVARRGQIDLAAMVDRLVGTMTDHFSVKRTPSMEPISMSRMGREWLHLMAMVGDDLFKTELARVLEPRLELLVRILRERLPPHLSLAQLGQAMLSDPWGWMTTMNGTVALLRDQATRPAHVNACRRYKEREQQRVRELTAYFKPLSLAVASGNVTSAHVMRLELHRRPHYRRFDDRFEETHAQFSQWLRNTSERHGRSIGADVWRFDRDESSGLYVHVLLAFNGPMLNELPGIKHRLVDDWIQVAGDGACVVDCKGPRVQLQYRGRCDGAHGDSVATELKDAVTYLARTDAPYLWTFNGELPVVGMGDCN